MQHYGRTKQAISDELGDYGRTVCSGCTAHFPVNAGEEEEEEEDSDSDRGKEVTPKKRSSCYQRERDRVVVDVVLLRAQYHHRLMLIRPMATTASSLTQMSACTAAQLKATEASGAAAQLPHPLPRIIYH